MNKIDTLPTPAFLVDGGIVRANADSMRGKAARSGVLFRPHVKTHKTVEIGRIQHGGVTGPITVSTLAEGEFFADGGFDDITYAVPIAPEKLSRAAALGARMRRLVLLLDSVTALRAIEVFHTAHGVVFDAMLKVDCGYHRAGVQPGDPDAVALAVAIARSPAIRFGGLLTHAGHSYHAKNRAEIALVAAAETEAVTAFREVLVAEGFPELIRSIGSTPTCSVVDTFTGCDEVRPGNYVFYDAFQSAIGSCSPKDVAVSVLATVIGTYPERGTVIVDAGALALSKDRGADHLGGPATYGEVRGVDLRPLPLQLETLSQEHGLMRGTPAAVAALPVGTKVRIVPNHSCLTAALFDRYYVLAGDEVVAEWKPVRGW